MPRHHGVRELSFGRMACLALSLVLALSKALVSPGFVLVSHAGKRPLCMVLNGLTFPNYFLALLPRPDPPQYKAFRNCCSLAVSKSCLSFGTQHNLCCFIIQIVCGLVSTGFVIHFWVHFSSVAQSCLTLCDPMNCSMPGLPVHHHLPEFTQTHIHPVSYAIQPSHPQSFPSPPAPNPAQHQSFPMSQLFAWGGQSTGLSTLASFLPKNTQGWSRLEWTGWISLQSKGLSRVFSNTTVQKYQFSTQLSSQSNFHIYTWPLGKP